MAAFKATGLGDGNWEHYLGLLFVFYIPTEKLSAAPTSRVGSARVSLPTEKPPHGSAMFHGS